MLPRISQKTNEKYDYMSLTLKYWWKVQMVLKKIQKIMKNWHVNNLLSTLLDLVRLSRVRPDRPGQTGSNQVPRLALLQEPRSCLATYWSALIILIWCTVFLLFLNIPKWLAQHQKILGKLNQLCLCNKGLNIKLSIKNWLSHKLELSKRNNNAFLGNFENMTIWPEKKYFWFIKCS